jgi:hypothetical protein
VCKYHGFFYQLQHPNYVRHHNQAWLFSGQSEVPEIYIFSGRLRGFDSGSSGIIVLGSFHRKLMHRVRAPTSRRIELSICRTAVHGANLLKKSRSSGSYKMSFSHPMTEKSDSTVAVAEIQLPKPPTKSSRSGDRPSRNFQHSRKGVLRSRPSMPSSRL